MCEIILMIVSSLCSFVLTVAGFSAQRGRAFRVLLVISFAGVLASSIMWYRDKRSGEEDQLRIVRQGELIDFLRDISPLPQRKMMLVQQIVEANMVRVVNTHCGWSYYSTTYEELRYAFTDASKTNFLGVIVLDREALEDVIRHPDDNQVIERVFQRLLCKTLVEASGKQGVPLERDIIDFVHSILRTLLPVEKFGYDRVSNEKYVCFSFQESPTTNREVTLTKDDVDSLAECSLYYASIRLYKILLAKGIDSLKVLERRPLLTPFAINI